MSLTIKSIESAKPKAKAYKLNDSSGLYIYVSPSGLKTWRIDFKRDGKAKTLTLGRYPEISLAQARQMNLDRKESGKQAPTFEKIFDDWLPIKTAGLSNPKHVAQIESTIRHHVLPHIGNMPINSIPRIKLIEVVKRLSSTPETASRVAGRIKMIFDHAADIGIVKSHEAADLARVITKNKVTPMQSIHPDETGQILVDIMTYQDQVTRIGLLLAAHVFVRVGELLGMRWSEIKWNEKVWIVPEDRMKMGLPHVVPLSSQVVELLKELRKITGASEFVLASSAKPGHPISENTLLFALYRLGYRGRMTVHGFRSLASSVLNEHSPFKPDVIERQLAHKETDKVRAAYHRAEYLDQRRDMMIWWSNLLSAEYNSQCQTPSNDLIRRS